MEVICPNCDEKYNLGNEYRGEKVQCWKCSYKFFVPQGKNLNLIECEDCGGEISRSAKVCPHCGRPNMSKLKKIVFVSLRILAVLVIIDSFIFLCIPFFRYFAIHCILFALFCLIATKR